MTLHTQNNPLNTTFQSVAIHYCKFLCRLIGLMMEKTISFQEIILHIEDLMSWDLLRTSLFPVTPIITFNLHFKMFFLMENVKHGKVIQ